jgi:hypothetical protein
VPLEKLLEVHETPGRLVPVKGPGYQVTCEDGDVRFRSGKKIGYGFEGMVYIRCKNQAHKLLLSGQGRKIPGRKSRFCQAWFSFAGVWKLGLIVFDMPGIIYHTRFLHMVSKYSQ